MFVHRPETATAYNAPFVTSQSDNSQLGLACCEKSRASSRGKGSTFLISVQFGGKLAHRQQLFCARREVQVPAAAAAAATSC